MIPGGPLTIHHIFPVRRSPTLLESRIEVTVDRLDSAHDQRWVDLAEEGRVGADC